MTANLKDMVGPTKAFQHVAPTANAYFDVLDGNLLASSLLRTYPAATGRDFAQFMMNTKGYANPIAADECILMGIITGCTHIRKVCFRGSEAGDTNTLKNVKTGAAALDAAGAEIPTDDCILDVGEVAAAWPATDVFLVRVDRPTLDQDGELAGIPLIAGAAGESGMDGFDARAMGQLPGNSCWAVVARPTAAVPDLATAWIEVEIANGSAL